MMFPDIIWWRQRCLHHCDKGTGGFLKHKSNTPCPRDPCYLLKMSQNVFLYWRNQKWWAEWMIKHTDKLDFFSFYFHFLTSFSHLICGYWWSSAQTLLHHLPFFVARHTTLVTTLVLAPQLTAPAVQTALNEPLISRRGMTLARRPRQESRARHCNVTLRLSSWAEKQQLLTWTASCDEASAVWDSTGGENRS